MKTLITILLCLVFHFSFSQIILEGSIGSSWRDNSSISYSGKIGLEHSVNIFMLQTGAEYGSRVGDSYLTVPLDVLIGSEIIKIGPGFGYDMNFQGENDLSVRGSIFIGKDLRFGVRYIRGFKDYNSDLILADNQGTRIEPSTLVNQSIQFAIQWNGLF